jgi:hypothetical protein
MRGDQLMSRCINFFIGVALLVSGCQAIPVTMTSTEQFQASDSPSPSETFQQLSATQASEYVWRGTSLALSTTLPTGPNVASIFLSQPDSPVNLEDARSLATQFDLNGAPYAEPSGGYLIVEGNRRLLVQSSYNFSYYPDTFNYWIATTGNHKLDDAEEIISDFMHEFDFDFDYTVIYSDPFEGYFVLPLTPDGYSLRFPHFAASGLLFHFNQQGIVSVDAKLMSYKQVAEFEIISAGEALEILLAPDPKYGTLEGFISSSGSAQAWVREYPYDQTITVYGYLSSVPSTEGEEPLVSLDGYAVEGSTIGIDANMPQTFVQATGQFHQENSMDIFVLDTWQPHAPQEGLLGTLEQHGDSVVIVTSDQSTLLMPDMPVDVQFPLENVYALGVTAGGTFEWNSFDLRMYDGSGGGGGGGGMGFYDVNLSGTPIPLPTLPTPENFQPQVSSDASTTTIESVDLVYLIPFYGYALPNHEFYIQPMWRFSGHFSSGDEFEVFVQALQPEYLSPAIVTVEPPG